MVRIVQCLCPSRHTIMGLAYEPGLTAAQKEIGGTEDITLTEENAADYLKSIVEDAIRLLSIDEACGICGSTVRIYEDGKSVFDTLEKALPMLRELEERQKITRMAIDVMRRARNN